jgi:hypothetical protein
MLKQEKGGQVYFTNDEEIVFLMYYIGREARKTRFQDELSLLP